MKEIYYYEGGENIYLIVERIENIDKYNKNTYAVKQIYYREDGKTIEKIYKYKNDDRFNGTLFKKIYFKEDGKTKKIDEFDNEEYLIKQIYFEEDGKNIDYIMKYDAIKNLFIKK